MSHTTDLAIERMNKEIEECECPCHEAEMGFGSLVRKDCCGCHK